METWYQWWAGLSAAAVLNAALWLLWGHLVVRDPLAAALSMLDAPQLFLADAWVVALVPLVGAVELLSSLAVGAIAA